MLLKFIVVSVILSLSLEKNLKDILIHIIQMSPVRHVQSTRQLQNLWTCLDVNLTVIWNKFFNQISAICNMNTKGIIIAAIAAIIAIGIIASYSSTPSETVNLDMGRTHGDVQLQWALQF